MVIPVAAYTISETDALILIRDDLNESYLAIVVKLLVAMYFVKILRKVEIVSASKEQGSLCNSVKSHNCRSLKLEYCFARPIIESHFKTNERLI